jgi:hypothetical protein
MALSECRVLVGGVWKRKGRSDSSSTPAGARFAGDPGPGKVLTGSTIFTGTANISDGRVWLNDNTGVNHVLSRHYFTNAVWTRTTLSNAAAAGAFPWPSTKSNITAAQIKAGQLDASLDSEGAWAATQAYPILMSYYHEPPDNFPSDANASDFRAAFRRMVQRFRAAGATNVSWGPVLSAPWDFQTSGGEASRGPWYKWDPDWIGTKSGSGGRPNSSDFYSGTDAVCNVFHFDQYSPIIGGTTYKEFSEHMDTSLNRMDADGRDIPPLDDSGDGY